MSRVFEVHAIKPDFNKELLKAKRVRAMILNEEKYVAKMVRADLYKTVEYWKHHVDFAYIMHYAGGNIYLEIGPVSSVRGSRIWWYINDGTANIPVVFHPNYLPKTRFPGQIGGNWAGDEYNLPRNKIVGKKLIATPPGIRPRFWTEILQSKYAPILYDAVDFAIKRGLDLV